MSLIDVWHKKMNNLDIWDVALIKFSVATAILFVITIWSGAMTWVQSVNPWYFLIAFIIVGIRPFYRFYIKK